MQSNKRSISREEKATLQSKTGKALIFLGESAPEVAELREAGFFWNRIIGIDTTPANVTWAKYRYRWEDCQFFHTSFNRYLPTYTQYWWSYVHLDYCHGCNKSRLTQVAQAAQRILPGGRLRVTFFAEPRYRGTTRPDPMPKPLLDKVQTAIGAGFVPVGYRMYESDLRTKPTMFTCWLDREQGPRV